MKTADCTPGTKVGRLTVKSIFRPAKANTTAGNRMRAICQCDCGNEITVIILNLGTHVNSCGCIKAERNKEYFGKPDLHNLSMKVWEDSSRHSLGCTLSLNEISNLIMSSCNYCMSTVEESGLVSNRHNKMKRMGIDRVNNSVGYHTSNCVPCCVVCNRVKRDNSLSYIQQLYPTILKNVNRLLIDGVKPFQNKTPVILYSIKSGCAHRPIKPMEDVYIQMRWGHRLGPGDMPLSHAKSLTYSNCFYCEQKLSVCGTVKHTLKCKCGVYGIGIDRINSDLGYTEDNTIQCCMSCNHIKREFTLEQFKKSLSGIVNNLCN
jgi:hypothetical protein